MFKLRGVLRYFWGGLFLRFSLGVQRGLGGFSNQTFLPNTRFLDYSGALARWFEVWSAIFWKSCCYWELTLLWQNHDIEFYSFNIKAWFCSPSSSLHLNVYKMSTNQKLNPSQVSQIMNRRSMAADLKHSNKGWWLWWQNSRREAFLIPGYSMHTRVKRSPI